MRLRNNFASLYLNKSNCHIVCVSIVVDTKTIIDLILSMFIDMIVAFSFLFLNNRLNAPAAIIINLVNDLMVYQVFWG